MLRTVEDYLAHITPFHRGKPDFAATVEASVTDLADLQAFLHTLFDAFDIDTAIGVQLDVVGEWVEALQDHPDPGKAAVVYDRRRAARYRRWLSLPGWHFVRFSRRDPGR